MSPFLSDLKIFLLLWGSFLSARAKYSFSIFEKAKCSLVQTLYKQRGKLARPFVHSGMVGICAMGIMLVPVVSEQFPRFGANLPQTGLTSVLSATADNPNTETIVSDHQIEAQDYTVRPGDTISSIASLFGISEETIAWENNLTKKSKITPGQTLRVLPVSGISHKVARGETIYSIAKEHQTDPQAIIDFPGNTFVNDETFSLAVGQTLIVPDGVPAEVAPTHSAFAQRTPDAGTVVASGEFVWPTVGEISQGYKWYHKGIDIANRAAPEVLAADSGEVIAAGWDPSGYGNKVVVEHGNGFVTLYGHLAKIYVVAGQRVARGNVIGQMGSTGRSTGTHLHFEIRAGGSFRNPLDFLR